MQFSTFYMCYGLKLQTRNADTTDNQKHQCYYWFCYCFTSNEII